MIAATSPKYPFTPWKELPPHEQARYATEDRYVDTQIRNTPDPSRALTEYHDAASWDHMRTSLQLPFRLNTAVMSGLAAALTPLAVGRFLNLPMGLLVPIGAFQLTEGIKHKDRALIVDGVFNAAIGATSVAAAFAPAGLFTLAPLAVVAAREITLALMRRDF